jgi:tRNA pseudouridine38-40 synthase
MISEALTVILKERIAVTGAGRTDTGVHARKFYAHFDFSRKLGVKEREKLVYNLNGYLPDDIAVQSVFPVPDDAHTRFSATLRTYQYVITKKKDPFLKAFSYYHPGKLDIDKMNRGAEILKKNLDFSSFAKTPLDSKYMICHVKHAKWTEKDDRIIFTISADRFLRNMVRAIVGTLIELGRSKIGLNDIQKIIEKKSRSAAGYSVPAQGLTLTDITYPDEILSEAPDHP